MKLFFLLMAAVSLSLAAQWERSGETVIDPSEKLQWADDRGAEQRDTVWRDAKKYCANLELEGFYDWRLPTLSELQGLVAASLADEVSFDHAAASAYWTSEIYKKMPINAWAVYWGNGHTFDTDRCDEAHVRCVRNR
jgi:hypothetical protein